MEKSIILKGIRSSSPVMISYVALGVACGIVLYEAGFSLFGIFLLSALLYAGAAQFLTASLITAGASISSIILMVFFLNLRYILMSASISSYVKEKSIGFMSLFSHTLSDESYGINYSLFREGTWTADEALVSGVSNYSVWVVSNVLGGLIGRQFPINTMIMNYALIAMFICMMVQQFISKEHIIAAIVSIATTVILLITIDHNIALVIATVIASFVGYAIERYKFNH